METAQRDANTKSSEGVGVGGFSVVSIQVYSVELWIVPRTWPKERRIFTQNVFLVHAQTILEVKEILVQFHCLSSSRNDLYRNRTDFLRGWERVPSSLRPSLPPYFFPVLWLCQAVHYLFLCDSLSQNLLLHNYLSHNFLYDFLVTEFLDERSYGAAQIRNAVRQNILRLILHSLQHPSPNLAHFLMGFELRKPSSKTNLQDPGK